MAGKVTVWADVRCPWCWIGHRRLATAMGRAGVDVTVDYRSFLLEPEGPAEKHRTVRQTVLSDWGMSADAWDARRRRIEALGRAEGLTIRLDTARMADSRGAHRLLKLAADRGLPAQPAWDQVYAAHLQHNLDLEDSRVLQDIGARMGLEQDDVAALLESADYADEVTADHWAAVALGISAVPTIVAGNEVLSDSRPVDELIALVRSAAREAVR